MGEQATLKKGWYWGLYPYGSRLAKVDGIRVRSTQERPADHVTFYILEATKDVLVPVDVPWIRFGTAPEKLKTDPLDVGAWEDGPSWEHYLYETNDAVVEGLEDLGEGLEKAAKAGGNALMWVAVALLIGGVGVFLARRK